MRGLFGNCNQFFITIGAFLTYILGTPWGKNNVRVGYSNSALVAAAILTIFEFLMLFTYETPRWLYSKGKDHLGRRVLSRLRGPKHRHHIENEIDRITASLKSTISVKEQILQFRSKAVLLPFILVIMLMFFQQFSGINAAIFYAASIFDSSGYDAQQSNLITAFGVGGVQIVATFISVVLIDLLGRRILLTISSVLMMLSSFTMGVFFFIYTHSCNSCLGNPEKCNRTDDSVPSVCLSTNFGILAIISMVVFIVGFSLGWGPIPWSSVSELLPSRVRSLAGSVATFTNWLFAVIITLCFKDYAEAVSAHFAWWTFSLIMFFSIIFVILFLPEAKGRTLEEIQEHFEQGEIFAISFGKKRYEGTRRRNVPFSSRASITDVDS